MAGRWRNVTLLAVLAVVLFGAGLLLAQLLAPDATLPAGMGNFFQPPESDPFALEVREPPQRLAAGEPVELLATIESQTAPHSRVLVDFRVDGETIEQVDTQVPPGGTIEIPATWEATAGPHTLEIALTNDADATYTSWTQEVQVQ
jgi:hypothetical protein